MVLALSPFEVCLGPGDWVAPTTTILCFTFLRCAKQRFMHGSYLKAFSLVGKHVRDRNSRATGVRRRGRNTH